jgi:methylenetetrahydrofolate reductase (NADPH)
MKRSTVVTEPKTNLEQRIESGKPILIAEMVPPGGADAEEVRVRAKRYAGKVHAVGVSDNPGEVRMAALAAAALVAAEGVEPILHVVTRDRNRIALVSECLGAQALGIHNILCTSGIHQTLGAFRKAKNVFDVDSVQLLQIYAQLAVNGSAVGAESIEGAGPFCLGAVTSPYADPLEMQVMRLAKKVTAGAKFIITQPVFDLERFEEWWAEVSRRGLHGKVAILAGVLPLSNAREATSLAGKWPNPMIPEAILERMSSKKDETAQRAEGIAIAVETIERLARVKGLSGFQIRGQGDDDAAIEVIEKSGMGLS